MRSTQVILDVYFNCEAMEYHSPCVLIPCLYLFTPITKSNLSYNYKVYNANAPLGGIIVLFSATHDSVED